MNYHVDIQNATTHSIPLTEQAIVDLAVMALRDHKACAELTLRLVDAKEMIFLNKTYRQQDKVTNVLAFPSHIPQEIELEYPLLGDVIICPEVLVSESLTLQKELIEHWSLIVIHGVLHLLGYDHIKDEETAEMQAIEIKLLTELGYSNPYEIEETDLE